MKKHSYFFGVFLRVCVACTLFMLVFTIPMAYAATEIKLKLAVVNPSDTETQTTPIRYDLPKGIGPDEIIDIGELDLKYDFDKGNYYACGSIKLKPSERLTLEIRLKDIWTISEQEIDFLSDHTELLYKELSNSKYAVVGDTLRKKIVTQLDGIAKKAKAPNLGVKDRINNYYENRVALKATKEEIGMLENLVLDVGGVVEERVSVPTTLAIPLSPEELADPKNVIEVTVSASNPSKTSRQFVDIKHCLPAEALPKDVLETSGLDIGYDFNKECFSVYKEKVELNPGETKTFMIKLRDVWKIPKTELDSVTTHTNNLITLIKGTEYFAAAKTIAEKITENIDSIEATQLAEVPPEKHIANYRDNTELLRKTKNYVMQLEKLITQSGVSPGVTVVLAESTKGGGPESKRPKGYEGIEYIAKSIFRGKAPSLATTWKAIWTIIGFLAVVGFSFFAVQLVHHRISVIDLLTGTYARTHLIDLLRQVHSKAEFSNGVYSILMIDIDNFKLFNDNYGHSTGDTVLRTVSSAIKQNVEKDLIVGRFGGDEFVIIIPNAGKTEAELIGENIRNVISRIKLSHKGQPLPVHASIGLCAYPEDAKSVDTLFSKADDAMYVSKKAGGNKLTVVS